MNIYISLIITTLLLFLVSIISFGQDVIVTNPIPLSFGTVAVNGSGFIRMDLDGNRYTNTGSGITALSWPGHPDPSCAQILITVNRQRSGAAYSLPSYIDLSGPNGTLRVTDIQHSTYPGGWFNILKVGVWSFDIGGTINNLTVNTSAGTFTGFFTVVVDYN